MSEKTKTLLVGDLHLKAQVILPMVEEKMAGHHCLQVILMGDYMDAYGQIALMQE